MVVAIPNYHARGSLGDLRQRGKLVSVGWSHRKTRDHPRPTNPHVHSEAVEGLFEESVLAESRLSPKTRAAVGTGEQARWQGEIYSAREPIKLEYHVRHLERPSLGTSYVEIVERVVELLGSLAKLDRELVLAVDTTGVGRPVADMLKARLEEWLTVDQDTILHHAWITITGGDSVSRAEGGGIRVPKRDLASAPLVLMQNKQLKIAEGLQLADTLRRELLNFKVKINIATGHDSYEAWREGDHDDLVLAVAMACWCGERYLRKEDSIPRPGGIATEGVPVNTIGRRP